MKKGDYPDQLLTEVHFYLYQLATDVGYTQPQLSSDPFQSSC